MQSQQLQKIQAKVEAIVFEKDGKNYIQLGNYALDFKKEYLYLGMTKSGNVKLGDERYDGVKNFFGKIYDGSIHAEGSRFIERIEN